METAEKKVLLVGLPESGKSTFTAALWGVVKSDEIPDSLKLQNFSGDDTYLNKLYEYWASAKELPRTNIANEGLGTLELSSRKNELSRLGKIIIPDLAGERFSTQWEKRKISKDHRNHLEEVNSILFFIHSKKINDGFIIKSMTDSLDSIFEDRDLNKSVSEKKQSDEIIKKKLLEKSFSEKEVPTQTILVDLLQNTLLFGGSIKKVAVIISAWDYFIDTNISPIDWISGRMPLLHQYLTCNVDRFNHKVWGISAQGGDLKAKEGSIREKLLEVSPVKRIVVTDGKIKNNDITLPIKWLFSNSD